MSKSSKLSIKKFKPLAFLVFFFILLFSFPLEGARLINIPVKIVQPTGEEIQVFASGDEFYNWLHDKDGYTILQHPQTGYYVYAIKKDGDLLPSNFSVSSDHAMNLASITYLNIPKYLKHSPEKRKNPKMLFAEGSPANVDKILKAPRTGTINNIVIFIRFSDESEFVDLAYLYEYAFNASDWWASSMRNYFDEASYNQLMMSTTFYPAPNLFVISYQDSHSRDYFKPYNETSCPMGYQSDTDRRVREHTLLKNAVDTLSSQIPNSLNIDGDNDGYVDNVCFIVSGGPTGWSELLWPHMWSLWSQNAFINGKRVWTYNFQLRDSLIVRGVGILCHEMFHSLGAPDLYHYSSDGLHPVYRWDLMEYDLDPPQHMGAYMKFRYGTWISSIPEITSSGTYTVNPLTSSVNNCYKIASPYSSSEYFVIEYRRNDGIFENSLPGEGLLVYRINKACDGQGNADGPPDEVYIYRPNGTTTADGTPDSANFSSNVGRTSLNDATNPSSFLSNGSQGGLDISNVSAVNGSMSFDVKTALMNTLTISAGTGGTTDPPPGTYSFGMGTVVTVRAIPDTTYRFTGWSGDAAGTTNPVSVTMDSSKSISANFIKQYTLTLTAGSGGTTDPSPGSHVYDTGTVVSITAVPDTHYRFTGWSGGAAGTTNPIAVTMDANKSVAASFERIIYAPSNFSGSKVLNRSLLVAEYINSLSWAANPDNINIVNYWIFQYDNGEWAVLKIVDASTFQYLHRNVNKDRQYLYAIIAENSEGRGGEAAYLTIQ